MIKTLLKSRENQHQNLNESQKMFVAEGDLVRWNPRLVVKLEKANPWGLNWKGGRHTGVVLSISIGKKLSTLRDANQFYFVDEAEILWQDGSISHTSIDAVEKIND